MSTVPLFFDTHSYPLLLPYHGDTMGTPWGPDRDQTCCPCAAQARAQSRSATAASWAC